jgi:drug/metabolite transporter (DMT)-like permease
MHSRRLTSSSTIYGFILPISLAVKGRFLSMLKMIRHHLSSRTLATVLLWILPLILSSNYIIARASNGVIPPYSLAFGRWMTAVLLMLPFVWGDRQRLFESAHKEWYQWCVLGALGMWICGAFVYIGGQTTSAGNISLIYAAAPIGIAVASSFALHETLRFRQKLGLLCALTGVLFIVAKGDVGSLLHVRFVAGDLWILVATGSWIGYTVLQQRWPTSLLPIQRLFCMASAGLIILLPFASNEVASLSFSWVSTNTILVILTAGIFPGLLSYLGYSFMVTQLGANRAALVLYLAPVYAGLVAWWWLGEVPQWFHAVGGALVFPSIYLASSGAQDK